MLNIIYDFDFAVLDALQKIHSTFLNVFLGIFTYLGEGGIVWIAAAVVMLLIPKKRAVGICLGQSLITMLLFSEMLLKHIVQRPRPYFLHPWIDIIVVRETSYSFPSGHTCSSFTAATVIFMYNKKLGIAAYICAALIGFSRLYFYVHYPTDVICGALLGLIIGFTVTRAMRKYFLPRFSEKLRIPAE